MRIINCVIRENSEGDTLASMPLKGYLNHLLVLDVHGQGGCGDNRDGVEDGRVREMEGLSNQKYLFSEIRNDYYAMRKPVLLSICLNYFYRINFSQSLSTHAFSMNYATLCWKIQKNVFTLKKHIL